EAIKANSYYDNNQHVRCGHVTDGFSSCDQTVEGELSMGAQEHFYLEPHACIVSPRDTDEYHVTCMTQNLDAIHTELAQVLGISQSQITVSVKRIGGGFGGKETRHGSVVFPVAVAAHKYKRPVRAVLDRDEDMRLTGTRHPILAKYKVGFNKNGKLVALEAEVYLNAGSSLDMSAPVSERCILTMSNAYKIPNVHIQGKLCRTNIASNTAFRGFGTPQAVFIMESIMDHVATTLGMDPVLIREINFYKQGDQVAYGQVIEKSHLLDCWGECKIFSNYDELKTNVEKFNKSNTNKKRGIALSPLTYGIGYPLKLLNKGSAQVNVYRDGSVLLLTSGVEMGQGLNTKMIQIASQVLNVDVKFIRVPDTSTDTAPNSSPTAGSMTSDLIGPAVVNACNEIKDKLKPLREAKPDLSWQQLVNEAIDDRKYLSAIGFYAPEVNGMDWSKTVNSPFQYYSFGACCSVVEIDCLNGDHTVLSTHIVMDVGHSLNTAIDIGQIEGAFLQGYGLMCLEQYKMSAKGSLLSSGPGTYKIPSFSNIPKCFNVALLKNEGNPKAVYSSKAIGEPPLCLSVSVLMAIKSAIQAARPQRSAGHFFLHAPATPDRIRMGCDDDLAQMFTQDAEADAEKPFFVVL
ncbi:xanthine dehydrogenase-like, partial [Physella acuta]|uniref:xanthine dehydrogenase-like n=1 Tax=Physella acuta TaxID=109671 RepID=UPI0027DC0A6C